MPKKLIDEIVNIIKPSTPRKEWGIIHEPIPVKYGCPPNPPSPKPRPKPYDKPCSVPHHYCCPENFQD